MRLPGSNGPRVRGRAQDLLYGAAAYFYAQETMNSAAKDAASQATFQHNVNAYQGLGRDAFYAHLHQQYVALGYPPRLGRRFSP